MKFMDLQGGESFDYLLQKGVVKLIKIAGVLLTHAGHEVNAISLKDGRPLFISGEREVKKSV